MRAFSRADDARSGALRAGVQFLLGLLYRHRGGKAIFLAGGKRPRGGEDGKSAAPDGFCRYIRMAASSARAERSHSSGSMVSWTHRGEPFIRAAA